jgi:molybdenum cofactor biosynthesis enzyme MoaA
MLTIFFIYSYIFLGQLTEIPGLGSVSMTTNGIALTRQLVPLLRAGLKGLNISLDSLDKDTYTRMARRNGLAKALAGIDLALQLGVNPVKVNISLQRGWELRSFEGDYFRK